MTVTSPAPRRGFPRSDGEHGLIGILSAALFGGGLEAERADSTFRVRARIPTEIAPRDPPADRDGGRSAPDLSSFSPPIRRSASRRGTHRTRAVAQARPLMPDVVLMDVRMPDLDGIAAAPQLLRVSPDAKVLILTTFEHDDWPSWPS